MLDADRWIEDQLRLVLREEANAVPFALTVADLQRRRVGRARPSVLPRRALPAWAAAIGLVLLGVVGFLVLSGRLDGLVPPAPTPTLSPAPSAAPTLPTSAELLEGTPPATLRLDSFIAPARSIPVVRIAGIKPNRIPVSSVAATAKASTLASIVTSSTRGMLPVPSVWIGAMAR